MACLFVEEPHGSGNTDYHFQLCKTKRPSVLAEHITFTISDLGNGLFGDISVARDSRRPGTWPPNGTYAVDALYKAVFDYLPGRVTSRLADHWDQKTTNRWERFVSEGLAVLDRTHGCYTST